MDKLIKGIKKFCEEEALKKKDIFNKLKRSQNPHTLFIACSDSRVMPGLITSSQPGDLFVVRNIANIVPYYRESDEYLATTSAVEYAVQVLKVENIVVCGHSNCGGCRALMSDKDNSLVPHVSKWMELSAGVKEKVRAKSRGKEAKDIESMVEKENIIQQLKHLMTYPFIKEGVEENKIKIYGWYYDIGKGAIYSYDREREEFIKA